MRYSGNWCLVETRECCLLRAVMSRFKLGICQLLVDAEKSICHERAKEAVREVCSLGANLVALPECFNGPYATAKFRSFAEPVPPKGWTGSISDDSPSVSLLKELALAHKVYVVGGSIPELDGDRVFNTSIVFNPTGEIIAKHRKVHLFDIDIPGKMTFRESDALSAGDSVTVFETEFGVIGLAICYDLRFPELCAAMRRRGATCMLYPGAFNMTTGPAHWKLLQQGRAVDNQVYVAGIAPARNPESEYQVG